MMQALDGPSVLEVFDTNAVGIVRVTEAALLLEQSENPVVVNVSSALGSFWATHEASRPASHFVSIAYGASKAAVSMLTVQYAHAHPQIRVNAVEPGITATQLGGGDPGSHPGPTGRRERAGRRAARPHQPRRHDWNLPGGRWRARLVIGA
jgi:NAD(P)-dependent dehydrogenase (short-subunit alcohol dehydrogenase family)